MEMTLHNDPIHYVYDNNKSDTLVVMLHGLTMDSYMYPFNDLAKDIYNLGFDVLRFDFIGHGKSYGESKDMTIKKEIDDAVDMINHFKSGYKQLIIMGHSQGGLIAGNLANIFNPSKLILLCPGYNLKDCAINRVFFGKKIKDDKPVHIWNMTFSKEYLKDIALDCYYDISYEGPITIIHGDKDILVPIEYSLRLKERYPNIDLKIIRDSDHEFIGFYEELWEFVKKSLL